MEMHMINENNKIDCCGCEGCRQICPEQCITMEFKEDGFLYPFVDSEKCVKCNLCTQVCPIVQARKCNNPMQEQKCYYGWHKNDAIRYESTSGGAFSAIAEIVLEEGGVVYGAIYDDLFKVRHIEIQKIDGLAKLRQSKYVQSSIGNCFIEIKKKLHENIKILFCGTPCQVHGLRVFLKKTYENLLLVDFVCHGVTSPHLFDIYLKSLEKKYKSKICRIRFRDKIKIGNYQSVAFTTIEFVNGRKISSEINSYLIAYMHGLMHRESCEGCPYASLYRWSDITIGDFWGIEKFVPGISEESKKGISMVIANSEKGRIISNKLSQSMFLKQVDVSYALNGKNQQLIRPVKENKHKKEFYQNALSMSLRISLFKAIGIKKCLLMFTGMIKNRIKIIVPESIKSIIINLSQKQNRLSF